MVVLMLSNVPPPAEGVRFQQPQVKCVLEREVLGSGSLYIAESCVSWIGDDGRGFQLTYPAISLHAISRDLTSYPEECIYLMIDANATGPDKKPKKTKRQPVQLNFADVTDNLADWNIKQTANGIEQTAGNENAAHNPDLISQTAESSASNGEMGDDEDNEDDDDDGPKMVEMRLVPADRGVLDQVFDAMSDCQQLHPDEEDEDAGFDDYAEDDGGGDNQWITADTDPSQVYFNEEGQAVINRLMGGNPGAAGDGPDVAPNNGDGANDDEDTMDAD